MARNARRCSRDANRSVRPRFNTTPCWLRTAMVRSPSQHKRRTVEMGAGVPSRYSHTVASCGVPVFNVSASTRTVMSAEMGVPLLVRWAPSTSNWRTSSK